MALAGSSVALKAMDEDVLKAAVDKFAAKKKDKEKEATEILHGLEIAKRRGAENAQQKETITKLEKEISSLQAKLFFWRTPAILAGVAAAAYGSWVAYEWWTGNDTTSPVSETSNETPSIEPSTDDASSTNSDDDTQDQNSTVASPDESSQEDAAPATSHDVLTVPNSTPPGSQD